MVTTPSRHWTWDQVLWTSHCGNCIANCAYRMYARDGEVVFEEQSGDIPGVDGVPDMNPLGCQKGAAWHTLASGGERVLHPMRRVGERGSGRWEQVSWDEALTAIADAVIDNLESTGPHSIVIDDGAEGGVLTGMGRSRFAQAIDAVTMDGNSTVSDVHLGHWLTFGGLLGGSTADDTFRSEVIIIWHANPAFTRIPYFHYLPEARYRGAQIVLIAPDYSPAAMHVDMFVPVVPGSDAALSLAVCHVLLDENLADLDFVSSQTDLPFLVRKSNKRFLRDADMEAGGRSDGFYVWSKGGAVPVDRGRLPDPAEPSGVALEGCFKVTLADGTIEEVTPVFALVRERLGDYAPKQASEICGVHPDVIRTLARMVASRRTKLYNGLGSSKHHHGDLMERSMDLVLALTGNWGKPGTGFDTYIIALLEGEVLGMLKRSAGIAAGESMIATMDAYLDAGKAADPPIPEGKAVLDMMRMGAQMMTTTPPAFYLYYHCGFDKIWDNPDYSDSPRPMREYVEEARSSGWWTGLVRPDPDVPTRMIFQVGTNTLRRTRGGQRQMLEHLWPSLDMIVLVDWRMNTVGMYADYVLPVACEEESVNLHTANSHSWERMFSDKAREPVGESRTDWQIFRALCETVSRRAEQRGLETFMDRGAGRRKYAGVIDYYTMGGVVMDDEAALDELLRDSAMSGNLPPGTSLATLREIGWVRPEQLPRTMAAVSGSQISGWEPFVAYSDHVVNQVPFPTLTGRAQFYVDHPWFSEADEQLPRHKPPPRAGGDYPLQLTGGHPRWSIHATNTTSRLMLETTRGHPVLHMNPADAAARGIDDEGQVRLYNDMGDVRVAAKLSPAVRPGQVILYASWEQYLYPGWRDVTYVEPGMVKWLHFAGGYGHLGYSALQWQPEQSDRLYRVEAEALHAHMSPPADVGVSGHT